MPPSEQTKDPLALTYYQDIKPILDARCVSCHLDGGIGPFALDSFERVSDLAFAIKSAVVDRRMPPWPAAEGCAPYDHQLSMTQAEIDAVAAWVDAGAQAGDPQQEGAALPTARPALTRIDHALRMDEPHPVSPSAGDVDEHVCFLIDWPETEPVYITGYEAKPSNLAVAHHFVGTIISPENVAVYEAEDATSAEYGWRCGAGEGMGNGGQLFATWVPGRGASIFPKGTGLRVEPGSKILLNMHYNTISGGGADQTELNFTVERQVERPATSIFFMNPLWPGRRTMDIPAGQALVEHVFERAPGQAGTVTVHSVGMHLHTLGVASGLEVIREDGSRECLLNIPRWDYDWQLQYSLSQAVELSPRDRIRLWCQFDTSTSNQPIVDGEPRTPRDVNWGENTFDEMCLGTLYLTQ